MPDQTHVPVSVDRPMTLGQHLQQAFVTIADRFHDELARELRAAAADAVERATVERDRAVQDATARAHAMAELEVDEERSRFDRRAAEMVEAAEVASRDRMRLATLAAGERLIEALRTIDRGRSLSEILDALISFASHEAARVAMLLVRGEELHGWRFVGFGRSLDSTGSFVARTAESGVIAEAIRTGGAVSATGSAAAPPFAQLTSVPATVSGRSSDSLAVPVTIGGEIVAVLYADSGDRDEPVAEAPLMWQVTLELFARHAARCLEAATALNAVRVLSARTQTSFRPSSREATARIGHRGE